MKPTPICEVIRRIRPFSAQKKQKHIAELIEFERQIGRTKRLKELEALAFSICFPQVAKAASEVRRERRARH